MSHHDRPKGQQEQQGQESGRDPVRQLSLFGEQSPDALQLNSEAAAGAVRDRSSRSRSKGDDSSHPENWLWDNCPMLLGNAASVDDMSALGRWDDARREFHPDKAALEREKFHEPAMWTDFRIAVASVGRFALIAHTAETVEHTGRELWKGVSDRKLGLQICLGMNLVRLELVTAHGRFETLRSRLIPGTEPTRLRRYQRWFRTLIASSGAPRVKMAALRAHPDLLRDWSTKRIMDISLGHRSFEKLLSTIHAKEKLGEGPESSRTAKRGGYRKLLELALVALEQGSGNEALIAQIKDRLRD